MIVSAISLWKKFNVTTPLNASEWAIEERGGVRYSDVTYSGHEASDGSVRIYARFARPVGKGKQPTVLLLPDAGALLDKELCQYFLDKGYAVLMPDYSGKMPTDTDSDFRTIYPPSLAHGNLMQARGLKDMDGLEATQTTWFEWLYVSLFSLEYLRSREDVGAIGVVGVRTGGALAWQTMLSPHVKCGVPINAVGWKSFLHLAKFGEMSAHHLSDAEHSYIASVEAQSYAPYVRCPVLMLCALRDDSFDCDRAYDTYSRIGNQDGNALVYSSGSGACIGPNGLTDMDLFLEKNLKGREIYIPDTLNISLKETEDGIDITVDCDKEGILEEAGIFYAEADVRTKCAYRDWQRIYKVDGKSVKNGQFTHTMKPFDGAPVVFAFAYAKYINGFRVMSKITAKRLSKCNENAMKGRSLFTGEQLETFSVAEYKDYSISNIFLEKEAVPKRVLGYGNIAGAYSLGGIRTYKISSPTYMPDENALLKFDVWTNKDAEILVSVEAADVERDAERFTYVIEVKGGGKWKRIVCKAGELKGETSGMPLKSFAEGRTLLFDCEDESVEFAVTNILWL